MIALIATMLAAGAVAAQADASQIVSTSSVTSLTLGVNNKGEAMVSYHSNGKLVHVLAWGAINAVAPLEGGTQTALILRYDGGYQRYYATNPIVKVALTNLRNLQAASRKATAARNNPVRYFLKPKIAAAYALLTKLRTRATTYWKTFTCPFYDGPQLAWAIKACKAPDGSYWAIQQWQRKLPNYGLPPTPTEAANEVHLSHWSGALPVLDIQMNWAYKRYDHLFGTFTYAGTGVYGFHSTAGGEPLDRFGRNLYVDTLDSVYGPGWERDNSFLTHKTGGSFCYGLYPHGDNPSGKGTQYRATIIGPGVTPDMMWTGVAPGPYDATAQAAADAAIVALGDPHCKQV